MVFLGLALFFLFIKCMLTYSSFYMIAGTGSLQFSDKGVVHAFITSAKLKRAKFGGKSPTLGW